MKLQNKLRLQTRTIRSEGNKQLWNIKRKKQRKKEWTTYVIIHSGGSFREKKKRKKKNITHNREYSPWTMSKLVTKPVECLLLQTSETTTVEKGFRKSALGTKNLTQAMHKQHEIYLKCCCPKKYYRQTKDHCTNNAIQKYPTLHYHHHKLLIPQDCTWRCYNFYED